MKTDVQLQNDVLAELHWDPSINAAQIGVEVKNGAVTLSGHLDWEYQRQAALQRRARNDSKKHRSGSGRYRGHLERCATYLVRARAGASVSLGHAPG